MTNVEFLDKYVKIDYREDGEYGFIFNKIIKTPSEDDGSLKDEKATLAISVATPDTIIEHLDELGMLDEIKELFSLESNEELVDEFRGFLKRETTEIENEEWGFFKDTEFDHLLVKNTDGIAFAYLT